MIDRSKCEGCHLQDQEPVDTITSGDDPGYMVVTEAPAAYNAQRGRLLSNNASKVLSRELASLGFDKDDFLFVPQIRCVFDPDTLPSKTKALIQKQCRAHLLDTIKEHRPDVIIPLGAEPSKQVHGRAVKITKVRGQAEYSAEHDSVVIPMLHPGYVAMYPQHYSVFKADCNTFARVVDNDLDIEAASNINAEDYHIITDLQFLIDMEPSLIFFDTETTGLEFFHKGPDNVRDYDPDIHGREFDPSAAILTMQFCVKPGTAYMLVWDHPEQPISLRNKAKIKKQLVQLFGRKKTRIISQNSKFDSNFVFETLGIRYEIGGDTLMLAALLDENMISKGQDVLVKHYVTEKAGYADCVALGTEILTADMRKVPAESLRVGDEICAFTHDTSGVRAARRSMQKAVVTGAQILRRSCVKITTKSGRTITVSTGHLMLSKLGHHDQGGGWRWVRADELTVGRVLKPFPWEDAATDYDAGYVSGIIDGEGWLCAGKLRLGIAQRGGVVLENTRRVIKRYGLEIGHSTDSRKDVPVVNITFDGKDCIKALQVFRPLRLLDSAKWEGAGLPTNGMRADEIVDIRYVGLQEVVGLRTTTQTIIANGLLSHNSFNATYDKSRMWEVPLDAMIRYGCGDVDTGFMLYKVLIKKLLEDALLTAQYRYVSLPGLNTFADVEVNGIEVDDDALQAFQIIMEESVADQYRSLIAQVPRSIRKKHIDKGLAFSRSAFLLDILFEHRDGFRLRPKVFTKSTEKLQSDMRVPSVSTKDHLPYFFEECPFTEELATYIKDERLLTTSVKGFNKKYIHDGLVRPTYALWVTVTGRTSSENPNGQNFPKRGPNAKAYRRIFIAPRGWVVIEADLSQAELRIAADMANEQTMLRIYREGGDIHKSTALIVMGVSLEEFLALPKEEQKAARQKAKAVNFGFIYGMGWRKFIGYAKTQYGVEFSEQEAQRIREAFFSLYSGLTRWHEAMRAWAREHGYVRSYSGRIRHLPMIYSDDEGVQQEAGRQAINSPVQNFASDLGVIAISRMRKAIDPAYLKPIAFVHDAIYCYAREEYAMWGAETIKYYMESNPLEVMFNRRMKVPIVADVSVGRNFGDTYELEGFTSADEFDVGTLWNEDEKSGILLPKQIAPYKNGARQQHIYCTAD